MGGLGAAQTDLRIRASLGSSGNQSGLGQSWPPGRWRPTPPSLVVVHLFVPQWDYMPCACIICRHPPSSAFRRWPHWFYFFRSRSSLILFFGWSVPKSVMVSISGSWKVATVSVMMEGWQLSLYVASRYCSSSFIILVNFSDALGPRSKV